VRHDHDNGRPLKRALVSVTRPTGESVATVRTDEAGHYQIPVPPTGRYILTVVDPHTQWVRSRQVLHASRSAGGGIVIDRDPHHRAEAKKLHSTEASPASKSVRYLGGGVASEFTETILRSWNGAVPARRPGRVRSERMSVYQMQKCLFDYLHARKHGLPERKSDVSVEGYDLTDDERRAVGSLDVGKLYAMGTHPVIINSLCRSMGYRRADYRPLLAESAAAQPGRARWRKS
jgi:hypothetical protein